MKHIIFYLLILSIPLLMVSDKITLATSIGHAISLSSKDYAASELVRFAQDLSSVCPLTQAHSHNDYWRTKPLLDALEHGFTYIEADVHLVGNELYVSHNYPIFKHKKQTLKTLYLEPLSQIFSTNKGAIYPSYEYPIYLMIDIKSDAEKTLHALQKYIEPYQHLLTFFEGEKVHAGAVTIFLSGNRPVKLLANQTERWMALDGRLEDLGKGYSNALMPVVSQCYSTFLGHRWQEPWLNEERWGLVQAFAATAHAEGKKVRLWHSPEEDIIWQKLIDYGVDIINTDELGRLSQFLNETTSGLDEFEIPALSASTR